MNETLQAKDQSTTPRCEAAHSPLPWKFARNGNDIPCLWTTKPAQNIIASFYHIPHEENSETLNAAYIVKACNEYPKLLKALEPFALAFDEASPVSSIPDDRVWLWKPSNNKRETSGISLAHLKAAKEAITNG